MDSPQDTLSSQCEDLVWIIQRRVMNLLSILRIQDNALTQIKGCSFFLLKIDVNKAQPRCVKMLRKLVL